MRSKIVYNILLKRQEELKPNYVREAILRFLEDMEDKYLALSRLESSTKKWTLDELEHEIDLEG